MHTRLSLAVQYGAPAATLTRSRLRRWAQKALDTAITHDDLDVPAAQLTVRVVDADEGRTLNREFRERDYATNVLTFAYGTSPDGIVSADIVLCLDVLTREAEEQHKTLLDHAAHLLVHGVLHALGYDHHTSSEAEAMEALETRILAGFRIADPYAA